MSRSSPRERRKSKIHDCTCSKCVVLCERNPGWFTPEEAELAIKAGHARKLMRDWLEGKEGKRTYVLAPASEGYEGDDAPEGDWVEILLGRWEKGCCVFLKDQRCMIHDSGFKPKQCRESMGCVDVGIDNFAMARLWQTEKAKEVLAMWHDAVRRKP